MSFCGRDWSLNPVKVLARVVGKLTSCLGYFRMSPLRGALTTVRSAGWMRYKASGDSSKTRTLDTWGTF